MRNTTGIRALRARVAAHTKWAKTSDRTEATAPARAAALARFYDQTDPTLPETVRLQQAESLKSAYFASLALKSALARRSKTDGKRVAEAERRLAGVVHPDTAPDGEGA